MKRGRLIDILETYRPGENLETDPEVRQALEEASRDPELARIRTRIREFDEVFGQKLRSIPVPETLYEDILAVAADRAPQTAGESQDKRVIRINWLHPAAFAAAAAIVILLALSFTFWNRPGTNNLAGPYPQETMTAGMVPLMNLARSLYDNRKPAFKSRDGTQIADYLRKHSHGIPAGLPEGFSWDRSFACDVIDVNGAQVSMICFLGPDMQNAMHLFTFRRADFPDVEPPSKPRIFESGSSKCATWANGAEILILYSDGGSENLRRILDI